MSRETVFVMPFGDEKVTLFSGFPPNLRLIRSIIDHSLTLNKLFISLFMTLNNVLTVLVEGKYASVMRGRS